MALQIIVTDAGRAALVNATNTGTLPVTIARVGVSATAVNAVRTATTLPGEIKRLATFSGAAVASDTLHLSVRDETSDSYTLRSLALYLGDGTLFALYGQAAPILEKTASSVMLAALDITFADITATSFTFGATDFLNPPATTTVQGVVELADDGEAQAMADAARALTPRGLGLVFTAAKILQRLLTVDGSGSGLDADLLDGLHASDFIRTSADQQIFPLFIRNGTPSIYLRETDGRASVIHQDGGVLRVLRTNGADSIAAEPCANGLWPIEIGVDAGTLTTAGAIRRAGNTVWDAGNDGAGSGLDADLLDGRHAADFALLSGATFTGPIARDPNFYLDAPNGNPLINVDAFDYQVYDRANNTWLWFIGGSSRLALSVASLLFNGQPVWHAGNDGNGSGLDSDLLDGQDGSWYSDIAARLGYQPFSRSGGTPMNGDILFDGANNRRLRWTTPDVGFFGNPGAFGLYDFANNRSIWGYAQGPHTISINTNLDVTVGYLKRAGNQVWDAGNDGNGSGLDADLLDGQDGSWYSDIAARLGYQPFSRSGGTPMNGDILFDGANNRRLRWATPDVGFYGNPGAFGLYDFGNGRQVWGYAQAGNVVSFNASLDVAGYLHRGGNQVWDAGNDGAGSGSDADLLDGWERDQVRDWNNLLNKPGSFPPSGHGHSAADIAGAFGAHDFGQPGYQLLPGGLILQWGGAVAADSGGITPITFPVTFPNRCLSATASNDSGNGVAAAFASVGMLSRTGMNVSHIKSSAVGAGAGTAAFWIAIGY